MSFPPLPDLNGSSSELWLTMGDYCLNFPGSHLRCCESRCLSDFGCPYSNFPSLLSNQPTPGPYRSHSSSLASDTRLNCPYSCLT